MMLITCVKWQACENYLLNASPHGYELLKRDPKASRGYRAPAPGETMKLPELANTFRLLGRHGRRGFYRGQVAEAIVNTVKDKGGCLDSVDLEEHETFGSQAVEPISLRFRAHGVGVRQEEHFGPQGDQGVEVWEHPPNGQGIVALIALGILQELERTEKIPRYSKNDHNSAG
jgi:gamma-glutamyltranspeptidase / glutathione hydrolase